MSIPRRPGRTRAHTGSLTLELTGVCICTSMCIPDKFPRVLDARVCTLVPLDERLLTSLFLGVQRNYRT